MGNGATSVQDRRIWFVVETVHPEDEGVGWYTSRSAFGMADRLERSGSHGDPHFSVGAICTQPSYSRKGTRCPKRESYRGVEIFRCSSLPLDRQKLFGRLVNQLSTSLSMFCAMVYRIRRGDVIFVSSVPPMLPFLAVMAAFLRRARCVIWSFDVYPEIAVAVGVLRPRSWTTRCFTRVRNFFYRRANAVVAIGRDMKEYLESQLSRPKRPVTVDYVPLFVDTEDVRPVPRTESLLHQELGLMDKFVVQIAGNLGFVHDVDLFLKVAKRLEDTPQIHFLLFSSGKKIPLIEKAIAEEGRTNITVHPRLPRERTPEIVSACDVAIGPLFVPGMYGLASPSRTYGILASGKPVLALTEEGTEVDLQIRENGCGWSIRPQDVDGFERAIREAYHHPERVRAMGDAARKAAVEHYAPEQVIDRLMADVLVD